MRDAFCGLSLVKHLPSGKPEWGDRSGCVRGPASRLRTPLRNMEVPLFESQAHLAVWTAFLFYVSFAWRKKQAVEIDPMQASAGWLAGELSIVQPVISNYRRTFTWTRVGPLRFPDDPSCASAPFQDPGRTGEPLP
jgi:hypothetical protein